MFTQRWTRRPWYSKDDVTWLLKRRTRLTTLSAPADFMFMLCGVKLLLLRQRADNRRMATQGRGRNRWFGDKAAATYIV